MNKRQWYYCDVCKIYTQSPDQVCSKCNNPIDIEWNRPGTLVATPFNVSNELEKELIKSSKWYRRIIKKIIPRRKKDPKFPWGKSGWKIVENKDDKCLELIDEVDI